MGDRRAVRRTSREISAVISHPQVPSNKFGQVQPKQRHKVYAVIARRRRIPPDARARDVVRSVLHQLHAVLRVFRHGARIAGIERGVPAHKVGQGDPVQVRDVLARQGGGVAARVGEHGRGGVERAVQAGAVGVRGWRGRRGEVVGAGVGGVVEGCGKQGGGREG